MSDAEREAHEANKARQVGRAAREAAAAERLGLDDGAIVERSVYVGPDPGVGMVETICVRCARLGYLPESLIPPHLTERPVVGLCGRCQPKG